MLDGGEKTTDKNREDENYENASLDSTIWHGKIYRPKLCALQLLDSLRPKDEIFQTQNVWLDVLFFTALCLTFVSFGCNDLSTCGALHSKA